MKKAVSKGANRDARGRFKNGCPGGPGNPHVCRLAEYRQAVREAITTEDIRAVLVKILEKAKAGDMVAAREVLDRAIGRPAPTEHGVFVDMPALKDEASVSKAMCALLSAVAAGWIAPDQAAKVAGLIEMGRRSIELADHERQMQAFGF